jgi:hypothetical protein
MIPNIPTQQLISIADIPADERYQGLRLIRVQSDEQARDNFLQRRYQFLHETAYSSVKGTLTRKGMVSGRFRLTVLMHPTLQQFVDMVQYDPANPKIENYAALGMKKAHEQTQSDFKGQKEKNRENFRDYLIESVYGDRQAYLPVISGWQTTVALGKTVFVAFDEEDPDAMYGLLYLPKMPIMQADGQTQTAALFGLSGTKDAIEKGALESFRLTLEVELNMDERSAGQSFADRNGRGTKKNKNLVIALDTSSALSELREQSIKGTVFERRLGRGRDTSTSESATTAIVDLSTMEQMLLLAISDGKYRPEVFKRYHVEHFVPYARDFILLLESLFAKEWVENTPKGQDTFRRLYVHGWPFALKAIASAYHRARIDELAPLATALGARDVGKSLETAFKDTLAGERASLEKPKPPITYEELKSRLQQIDWLRYRKHWIELTGAKMKDDGKKRTFRLRSTGEEKIAGQAQNTKLIIDAVRRKILSDNWTELTEHVDEPLPTSRRSSPNKHEPEPEPAAAPTAENPAPAERIGEAPADATVEA